SLRAANGGEANPNMARGDCFNRSALSQCAVPASGTTLQQPYNREPALLAIWVDYGIMPTQDHLIALAM
ncbi:MAG: hypothetical protein PVH11_11235, partial [Anaerolineae bacterium]